MTKEEMITLLNLMNDIDVRGKKNLNNLLASIQLIEKAMSKPEEG